MKQFPLMLAVDAAGAGTLEVTCPYDEVVEGSVTLADRATAEAGLAVAHRVFRERAGWLTAQRRIEILRKTAELMEAQLDELALLAASEGGKPLSDSKVEALRALDGVRLCADAVKHQAGRMIPMDVNAASAQRVAFTRMEPRGVVVAVSAFNHPLNLIVHQVGPAVAAGCPVIVKPAGATPLSCCRFVELLYEAGLPEAWCQVLNVEDNDVTSALVTDPRTAFFSFIGSAGVGWMLRSKLAPGTRCALEHGGVAPVIVAPDADIEPLIPPLLKGGYYHAGQVCVSVQRVFVDRARAESVANALAKGANDLTVGDPRRSETEVGPLIRPPEVERVHEWVTQAVSVGGALVTGGEPMDHQCYRPTVLLDPPDDATISRKEVFGPVVCVYPYDSVDEAVARANSLPYAFQAAVFTRDLDRALGCWRELDAAAVMVNDHTAFRVDWMPFAGLRESGYGVGGIEYTLHDMQIEKMAVIKSDAL